MPLRTGSSQPWRTQSRSWLRKGSRLAEMKGEPSVAQPCSMRFVDRRPPAPRAFSKTSTSQPAAASVPAQLAPEIPAPTMPARILAMSCLLLMFVVGRLAAGGGTISVRAPWADRTLPVRFDPSQAFLHRHVRYARLFVLVSHHDESCTGVKRHRVRLRTQPERAVTARLRRVNDRIQQGSPDTAAAPGWQHRHPADMPVGQQARAADRLARTVEREEMQRHGVGGVPFHRLGNALLVDEHHTPDLGQALPFLRPVGGPDGEVRHAQVTKTKRCAARRPRSARTPRSAARPATNHAPVISRAWRWSPAVSQLAAP